MKQKTKETLNLLFIGVAFGVCVCVCVCVCVVKEWLRIVVLIMIVVVVVVVYCEVWGGMWCGCSGENIVVGGVMFGVVNGGVW